MQTQQLLDGFIKDNPAWKPPSNLRPIREPMVCLDCETTGLGVNDRPVGVALRGEATEAMYLPWGHAGKNLDKELIFRYLKQELKGKKVLNLNVKFDFDMLLREGLNLEELGCELLDVQHPYALLYGDERRKFSLNALSKDFLGEEKLDMEYSNIAGLPASVVGTYAEQDVNLAWKLWHHVLPEVKKQGLERVLKLENDLLYATAFMERAGLRFDKEKAQRWDAEIKQEYEQRIIFIFKETGLKVNPNSGQSIAKLFDNLGLEYSTTDNGSPSFTEPFLKAVAATNRTVLAVLEARQLDSLLTKYVGKYLRCSHKGRIKYQLHQLRGDEYGTVSGRFSSSNINIQQVYAAEKQEPVTKRWPIRELFIPDDEFDFASADAKQIEFRLFVHYSRSQRLIKRYEEDPDTDFHDAVTELVNEYVPMIRKLVKNVNFMKVYGGGLGKLMEMTGLPESEAMKLDQAYAKMFPEASQLMRRAIDVAEKRGYVKTFLGRVANFKDKKRLHSALNRVLQGTAADIFKLKMLRAYNEKKTTGFYPLSCLHDELDGNIRQDPTAKKLTAEMFAVQEAELTVPITWGLDIGRSWNL